MLRGMIGRFSWRRRSGVVAGGAMLLAVSGGLLGGFAFAQRRAAPMEVTTDTPAYCSQLSRRVSALEMSGRPASAEVHLLIDAGRRMCRHGQVLGGILRLRQALVLMLHAG